MKRFSIAFFLCGAAIASAQQNTQEKPVTYGEFVRLMVRFERAMRTGFPTKLQAPLAAKHNYTKTTASVDTNLGILVAIGAIKPGQGKPFDPARPVSRHEAAIALDAIYRRIEPTFLRKLPPIQITGATIKGRTEDGSQAAMERLFRSGAVPASSPLFAGKDYVLPKEMSTLLAQVAQRIAKHFQPKDDDL